MLVKFKYNKIEREINLRLKKIFLKGKVLYSIE
jgi:hypothetical protein